MFKDSSVPRSLRSAALGGSLISFKRPQLERELVSIKHAAACPVETNHDDRSDRRVEPGRNHDTGHC